MDLVIFDVFEMWLFKYYALEVTEVGWVLWKRENFSYARNCTPGPCHASHSPVLVTGDIPAKKKKNRVVFVIRCFCSLFQNVQVLLIFRSKSIFKVSVLKLMV
jgi:hypothetical protein